MGECLDDNVRVQREAVGKGICMTSPTSGVRGELHCSADFFTDLAKEGPYMIQASSQGLLGDFFFSKIIIMDIIFKFIVNPFFYVFSSRVDALQQRYCFTKV